MKALVFLMALGAALLWGAWARFAGAGWGWVAVVVVVALVAIYRGLWVWGARR